MEDKPFFSQGAYGCAMYPRITCKGNITKEKQKQKQKRTKHRIMSKIVEKSMISNNEIKMGKIVNQLMKGKKNKELIGVSRSCETKYENVSNMKQCNIVSKKRTKSQHFLILYSRYIPSVTLRTYLYEDFTRIKWLKTYTFLLNALRILQKENIVHHDLTANNIIVSNQKHNYHIIDFGLSFCIQDCFIDQGLNIKYLKMLFFPDTSFYLWPIDHHILGYMVRNERVPSQDELMYLIRTYYDNKDNVLFASDLEQYILDVYAFYEEQYIYSVMNIEDHIRDLITHASLTWDLYTISYTLLRRLMSNPISDLKYMQSFLNQALHYDYTKRPSLRDHRKVLQ